MTTFTALHAGSSVRSPVLLAVLTLAGLASAALLGLGLAALPRRWSRPYLLVVLALAALFARSIVATLVAAGLLDPGPHHLIEHGLDVTMAGLVVGAVYHARTVNAERSTWREET